MYADQPRSRISRELFYILKSMGQHYKDIRKLDEKEKPKVGHILVLMSCYMLKEEGMEEFRPKDIVEASGLSQTSTYRLLKFFAEEGILTENFGAYTCNTQTPDFLTNPDELYQRPLATVRDKDYHTEKRIQEAMASFSDRFRVEANHIVQTELGKLLAGVGIPKEQVNKETTTTEVNPKDETKFKREKKKITKKALLDLDNKDEPFQDMFM